MTSATAADRFTEDHHDTQRCGIEPGCLGCEMDKPGNYVQRIRIALLTELPTLKADLLDVYALLILIKGTSVTLEDVHDAWSVWRNRTFPDHRSLIPFGELTPTVQELDRKYMEAMQRVARSLMRR